NGLVATRSARWPTGIAGYSSPAGRFSSGSCALPVSQTFWRLSRSYEIAARAFEAPPGCRTRRFRFPRDRSNTGNVSYGTHGTYGSHTTHKSHWSHKSHGWSCWERRFPVIRAKPLPSSRRNGVPGLDLLPAYTTRRGRAYHADALEVLRQLPSN